MLSINIDIDFATNPKVERLTDILGDSSEIYLIRLWAYIAKHGRKNGGLEDWTGDNLEAKMRWYGEPGRLVETLLKLKFVHQWKNGFKVHNWEHHAAHLIIYDDVCKKNRKNAKKGWEKRRNYKPGNDKGEDASGMPVAKRKRKSGNAITKQNKTETTIDEFEPSSAEIHEASMSPERDEVFAYWVEARDRAGLKTLTSQEKPDAARVAAYILRGVFVLEDFRGAVDNLMADENSRGKYGLRGLLKNIDKWINLGPEKAPNAPEKHGMSLREIMIQQGMASDAG